MSRIFLLLLLAGVSSSAMAEWMIIHIDDAYIVYIDSSTIRKKGHKVKLWDLVDFKESQKIPENNSLAAPVLYSSTKHQIEFDCKEELSQDHYLEFLSGSMGSGESVLLDNKTGPWQPIPPDTANWTLFNYACGKK
jgi:hypothetical protein